MTIEQWIEANFPVFMDNNRIVYKDELTIITATIEILSNILLTCSVPPKYTELLTLPIVEQGWQEIFDNWKERGLVK